MSARLCSIDGCERKHYGRGWCRRHYDRWLESGTGRPACSVSSCDRPARARGWCSLHYKRAASSGDPLAARAQIGDPFEAFSARTDWRNGCLIWTGNTSNGDGYGQIWDGKRQVRVHRWAWEQSRGPIPDGMLIDHTCWNRACCNIDHLRLATVAQNTANRSGATAGRTLPRGVYRHGNGYQAAVGYGGVRHMLGTFPTPEEASAVAEAKRAELFGDFAGAS